jgi:predicted SnoaL-like aldol condensation-catalyzing enzyme
MNKKQVRGRKIRRKTTTKGSPATRKKIVGEFFASLGAPHTALKLFAPDARQHNPYITGGMEALMDSIVAEQKKWTPKFDDFDFAVKRIFAEGDMVAAHTELLYSKSRPSEGGLRQVHLFRFDDKNRIAEYWDISQMVTKEEPNPGNAF